MKLRRILVPIFVVVLASCASKSGIIQESIPEQITKTGEDDRPEWTTQTTFMEKDGKLIYTGGVMGGADYTLTLRLAKAEATKNLLESIEIKARQEFSSALNGTNRTESDVGRYVTDTVAWTVENLRISGIKQRGIYYEQVFDPIDQDFKYNSWVQQEISNSDYAKAKIAAARRLFEKTVKENDDEAKEKALELLEKLKQEV